MTKYPDHETYKKLYRRFYSDISIKELLELAYPVRDTDVLDLCGGDGRLALKAMQYGAKSAVVVDREKDMTVERPKIPTFIDSVEGFLGMLHYAKNGGAIFNRIFCQQAVNYWLDHTTAKLVYWALKENGLFIFNTFHNKPSERPRVMEYEIEGTKYAEISWLVDYTVHHVQVMEGLPCDITSFQWLSPEYLSSILEPYFEVDIKKEHTTSLYRCLKK